MSTPPAPSQARFEHAFEHVGNTKPSDVQKLRLYGLCKVVRMGKVPANKKRPAAWDLVNRAKWDAWKAAESKGKDGAMSAYVS